MIYDVAIIGSGPAGLSAALNLKIHNKSFIWLGSKNLSEKIEKAEKISNYPGFFEVSGKELNEAFKAHIQKAGIEITEQMVNQIMYFSNTYALTAGSEFYQAKSLILATGISFRATLKNEEQYLGRGVSYCATCDGGLYKGKEIAVICNNARFEHEVEFLASLASKVYYFPQYSNCSLEKENIVVESLKAREINGSKKVESLTLSDESVLNIEGVFILRDSIALNTLLPELETSDGHIKVDSNMATNLKGVYAAGDCTGRPYQYTKAVGQGNIAAHSVLDYLAENK